MPKDWLTTAVELFSRRTEDEGGRHRLHSGYPESDHDLTPVPRAPESINCPIVRAEPHSLDEAAAVAVRTVADFLKAEPSVEKVVFCTFNREATALIEKEIKKVLAQA